MPPNLQDSAHPRASWLAEAVLYLACAPNNATSLRIIRPRQTGRFAPSARAPANAPTKLMKQMGYGRSTMPTTSQAYAAGGTIFPTKCPAAFLRTHAARVGRQDRRASAHLRRWTKAEEKIDRGQHAGHRLLRKDLNLVAGRSPPAALPSTPPSGPGLNASTSDHTDLQASAARSPKQISQIRPGRGLVGDSRSGQAGHELKHGEVVGAGSDHSMTSCSMYRTPHESVPVQVRT
jgi:hypothetical protein